MSKILETIIKERLLNYITKHYILIDNLLIDLINLVLE